MPAQRSRTENWRGLLETVAQRGGALELAFKPAPGKAFAPQADLVWRVRLRAVFEDRLIIETPGAAGQSFTSVPGVPVLVALTVGQNRWMFPSTVLASAPGPTTRPRENSLTLAMPDQIERCLRRSLFRASTGEMRLPEVNCWPLLDPTTVAPAEEECRAAIERARQGCSAFDGPVAAAVPPAVGPMFSARLMNLSGGGLGLLAPPGANPFNTSRFFWLRLDLRPGIPVPLAVTARLAHAHMDSHQQFLAGLAFEFTFNPGYQGFVTDLLIAQVQRLWQADPTSQRAAA